MRAWAFCILFVAMVPPSFGSDQPGWARRSFAASPDQVFRSARAVISLKHEIKNVDEQARVLKFHVGPTAWSWGYSMVLRVESEGSGAAMSMEIERSGGKAVSWGSGKKEVRKIFDATEALLNKDKKGATKIAP